MRRQVGQQAEANRLSGSATRPGIVQAMAAIISIDYLNSIVFDKLASIPNLLNVNAMAKSASFGVMHLGIAFGVTYALTGSLAVAGAVTVVEPVCNTVAHFFFDRWWDRRHAGRASAASVVTAGVA